MQGTWFGQHSMFVGFTTTTFGINPDMVLHVGEDAYDLNDATTGSTTYDWVIGDRTEWSEGDNACVALTDSSPPPPQASRSPDA